MKTIISVLLHMACLSLVAALPNAAAHAQTEMLWDDGTAEYYVTGETGQSEAVRFVRPSGSAQLTSIKFFLGDDGIEDPDAPGASTIMDFLVRVWLPGTSGPGVQYGSGWSAGAGATEGAWFEFALPTPIELSDSAGFTDGVFYVGMTWDARFNPRVGFDSDPPVHGATWEDDWGGFSQIESADAMIRAVVVDSTSSPVELTTWGSVKSSFR